MFVALQPLLLLKLFKLLLSAGAYVIPGVSVRRKHLLGLQKFSFIVKFKSVSVDNPLRPKGWIMFINMFILMISFTKLFLF
jgi:hypothetical protein